MHCAAKHNHNPLCCNLQHESVNPQVGSADQRKKKSDMIVSEHNKRKCSCDGDGDPQGLLRKGSSCNE